MKLVITIAALAVAGSAFKLDKKDATTLIRSKRANHDIVDLATVNSGTGAGATFWANLERECVEEQCGLEEAIETYSALQYQFSAFLDIFGPKIEIFKMCCPARK